MGNPSENSRPLMVSNSRTFQDLISRKCLSEKNYRQKCLEKNDGKEGNHLCESLKVLLVVFRGIKNYDSQSEDRHYRTF